MAAAKLPAGRLGDRLGHCTVMITDLRPIALLSWPLLRLLRDPAASLHTPSVVVPLSGAAVGLSCSPNCFPPPRATLGVGVTCSERHFSGAAGWG